MCVLLHSFGMDMHIVNKFLQGHRMVPGGGRGGGICSWAGFVFALVLFFLFHGGACASLFSDLYSST